MTAALAIRRATTDDAPALAALAARTFADTYRGLDDPQEIADYVRTNFSLEAVRAVIDDAHATTLLAEVGGELAGYAVVARTEAPACVTGPAPIELARFYLAERFIGRGHGAQLMRAVRREAQRQGAHTLWLGVYERNVRAIGFYERSGFTACGGKEFLFGGRVYIDPIYTAAVHRGVLLVVDVQVGVMRSAWEATRVVGNVARAVERARAEGVPVLWVQHADQELVRESAAWQWVPALVPLPHDVRIHKQFNSAFEQTSLQEELTRLGATHIVLAGAATNWCIRATAYAALERGYDLTLVRDAHTTETMELPDGTTIPAENVVRELNIAMTWLSYPDRRNGTASAEDVDFARPHVPA